MYMYIDILIRVCAYIYIYTRVGIFVNAHNCISIYVYV